MAQWGNVDNAANSVLWAPAQLNHAPTAANRDNLFGNTTADAFVTGQTVGQYGVDAAEAQALRAGGGTKVASSGWQLRTEGSGGRAGRVTNETLVALSGTSAFTGSDAADDATYPDATILILVQPTDAAGNSSADEVVQFTVVADTTPTAAITYEWSYTSDPGNTATWTVISAVPGITGEATATIDVEANTIGDTTLFRVELSATGAANVTSSEAQLTVTV